MWPVQLTAGLIGISLLGAQAPLSTYAGTDPVNGYRLGRGAAQPPHPSTWRPGRC